jgi:hypothetical protein
MPLEYTATFAYKDVWLLRTVPIDRKTTLEPRLLWNEQSVALYLNELKWGRVLHIMPRPEFKFLSINFNSIALQIVEFERSVKNGTRHRDASWLKFDYSAPVGRDVLSRRVEVVFRHYRVSKPVSGVYAYSIEAEEVEVREAPDWYKK